MPEIFIMGSVGVLERWSVFSLSSLWLTLFILCREQSFFHAATRRRRMSSRKDAEAQSFFHAATQCLFHAKAQRRKVVFF